MQEKSLLEPGLHDFKLDDIGNHFSKNFTNSSTRKNLIKGLNQYVSKFSKLGLPIELWIDGSFTTDKMNPNDIDLILFASENLVNNLDSDKKKELVALLDNQTIKSKYGCDVYFSPEENKPMRSYWRGWFGFDRNEVPKGIARIKVIP